MREISARAQVQAEYAEGCPYCLRVRTSATSRIESGRQEGPSRTCQSRNLRGESVEAPRARGVVAVLTKAQVMISG